MSAEAKLRRLFERRDRLASELARIDRAIVEEGRAFADREGYRMTLRTEALRQIASASRAN